MAEVQVKVYRVHGLDCVECANKFERNVKRLAGVQDARVNFGASKIVVHGSTTVEALEKAGAFENLKIQDEKEGAMESQPIWKQKKSLKVYLSAVVLMASWILSMQWGGQSPLPIMGYAAAILIGGYALFMEGLKNLLRLDFDMDTLMTIAILGAAAIGKWEEGATVVILFAISEALERYSTDAARQSIQSLIKIAPKETLIRRGKLELRVPVEEIEVGDIMVVKPGQKLAMDGRVVKGTSVINQAAITGESIPVTKTVHDPVYAGTLNEEGLLEVKVTKRAEDTTLARIIHLVEEAQAAKAPTQTFVDRFAKVYTPVIIVSALLLAVIPPLVIGASWGDWLYRGLALLVVGCPCALVISTPVAIVTAIGNAARRGVIIKGGIHLENAGALKAIAFDKTGTLTKGVPEVTDIVTLRRDEQSVMALAAAIEKGSQHPLASAICRKAEKNGLNVNDIVVEAFQSVTGKGVRARVNQEIFYIGSPLLFEETLPDGIDIVVRKQIQSLQKQGKTVMVFGTESEILSLIAVADELRETSSTVIRKLHQAGIEQTVMLTGDNKKAAESVGKAAGVSTVQAELLPEDKLAFIKDLCERYRAVAMVGDGVNDAPALAEATVGIAMGASGTDTALETADIALMSDDLTKLPYIINLSHQAMAVIRQNVSLSLAIKAMSIVLVFPGWLTLWMAVFADVGTTVIVTLNSLRLSRVQD